MEFLQPLVKAELVKRYKRFFVDALAADGTTLTAHCPNTGSMMGLLTPGNTVYLSKSADPKRKLQYTLEMIDVGTSLVGVHTGRPNHMVAEAIVAGTVPELEGYATLRQEVKYGVDGKSRIDILLHDTQKPDCYIEVKNTTLRNADFGEFPDAVTSRGLKHLNELVAEVKKGNRAVMFYVVNRADCTAFRPATEIDPAYAAALKIAVAEGVEVIAYDCFMNEKEIKLRTKLECVL